MRIAIFLVCLGYALASPFTWKDCGGPGKAVNIKSISVSPNDPVYIPGKISLSFEVEILRDITDITLDIVAKTKWTFFGWRKLPCVLELGSCTYQNACNILERSKQRGGSVANVAKQVETMLGTDNYTLTCPTKPRTLKISGYTLDLPKSTKSKLVSVFAAGDYDIETKLKNPNDNSVLGCLNLKVTIGRTGSIFG